jgi:hypothetical protein
MKGKISLQMKINKQKSKKIYSLILLHLNNKAINRPQTFIIGKLILQTLKNHNLVSEVDRKIMENSLRLPNVLNKSSIIEMKEHPEIEMIVEKAITLLLKTNLAMIKM